MRLDFKKYIKTFLTQLNALPADMKIDNDRTHLASTIKSNTLFIAKKYFRQNIIPILRYLRYMKMFSEITISHAPELVKNLKFWDDYKSKITYLVHILNSLNKYLEDNNSNTKTLIVMMKIFYKKFSQVYYEMISSNYQQNEFLLGAETLSYSLTLAIGKAIKFGGIPLLIRDNENSLKIIHVIDVQPNIIILHTKTKPKKLTFMLKDGKKQDYLVKSLEDLKMDQKVVQYFIMCNKILNGTLKTDLKNILQTYQVIPIFNRCGLIQMIEGTGQKVMSIYSLYEDWLKRIIPEKIAETKRQYLSENLQELNLQELSPLLPYTDFEDKDNTNPTDLDQAILSPISKIDSIKSKSYLLQKPLALFYSVLISEAKKKYDQDLSITSLIKDRKSLLTPDLIKQVYYELLDMQDSSNLVLINQNNPLTETDSINWFSKIKNFEASLSLSSIISYIIGLGDRHLGNLLIDSQKGTLIQIDFNICFERGKFLAIPETVPFRLTPIIENILLGNSFTIGSMGNFKTFAIETLGIIRQHPEIHELYSDWLLNDPPLHSDSLRKSILPTSFDSIASKFHVINTDIKRTKTYSKHKKWKFYLVFQLLHWKDFIKYHMGIEIDVNISGRECNNINSLKLQYCKEELMDAIKSSHSHFNIEYETLFHDNYNKLAEYFKEISIFLEKHNLFEDIRNDKIWPVLQSYKKISRILPFCSKYQEDLNCEKLIDDGWFDDLIKRYQSNYNNYRNYSSAIELIRLKYNKLLDVKDSFKMILKIITETKLPDVKNDPFILAVWNLSKKYGNVMLEGYDTFFEQTLLFKIHSLLSTICKNDICLDNLMKTIADLKSYIKDNNYFLRINDIHHFSSREFKMENDVYLIKLNYSIKLLNIKLLSTNYPTDFPDLFTSIVKILQQPTLLITILKTKLSKDQLSLISKDIEKIYELAQVSERLKTTYIKYNTNIFPQVFQYIMKHTQVALNGFQEMSKSVFSLYTDIFKKGYECIKLRDIYKMMEAKWDRYISKMTNDPISILIKFLYEEWRIFDDSMDNMFKDLNLNDISINKLENMSNKCKYTHFLDLIFTIYILIREIFQSPMIRDFKNITKYDGEDYYDNAIHIYSTYVSQLFWRFLQPLEKIYQDNINIKLLKAKDNSVLNSIRISSSDNLIHTKFLTMDEMYEANKNNLEMVLFIYENYKSFHISNINFHSWNLLYSNIQSTDKNDNSEILSYPTFLDEFNKSIINLSSRCNYSLKMNMFEILTKYKTEQKIIRLDAEHILDFAHIILYFEDFRTNILTSASYNLICEYLNFLEEMYTQIYPFLAKPELFSKDEESFMDEFKLYCPKFNEIKFLSHSDNLYNYDIESFKIHLEKKLSQNFNDLITLKNKYCLNIKKMYGTMEKSKILLNNFKKSFIILHSIISDNQENFEIIVKGCEVYHNLYIGDTCQSWENQLNQPNDITFFHVIMNIKSIIYNQKEIKKQYMLLTKSKENIVTQVKPNLFDDFSEMNNENSYYEELISEIFNYINQIKYLINSLYLNIQQSFELASNFCSLSISRSINQPLIDDGKFILNKTLVNIWLISQCSIRYNDFHQKLLMHIYDKSYLANQNNCPSYVFGLLDKFDYKNESETTKFIVNRMRDKIEGNDEELLKFCSLQHSSIPFTCDSQVNALILQAKSIENLSSMYEGWMSWI
ncbi:uncharacterized protein LOC135926034 isoform X2 [Gordionus sp. m RMFG-2023]|uniref:uncharacterized protein LOC135926034 isoform X2 n=1 Tax=Gordionus sp. m RMFG-2023 TaxID=3053472 RepID=UPI0031FD32EB